MKGKKTEEDNKFKFKTKQMEYNIENVSQFGSKKRK